MCARRHSADDDRERPPGLADALARWDTEQGWMRATPAAQVEPPESTAASYSPPGLPPPPSAPDSWEAVLSADAPPLRSTDPWATPAPAAPDDPEQELWTPPEETIYRPARGSEPSEGLPVDAAPGWSGARDEPSPASEPAAHEDHSTGAVPTSPAARDESSTGAASGWPPAAQERYSALSAGSAQQQWPAPDPTVATAAALSDDDWLAQLRAPDRADGRSSAGSDPEPAPPTWSAPDRPGAIVGPQWTIDPAVEARPVETHPVAGGHRLDPRLSAQRPAFADVPMAPPAMAGPAWSAAPSGATRADLAGPNRENRAGPTPVAPTAIPGGWPPPSGRPAPGRYGSLTSAEPPSIGGRYTRRPTGEQPTTSAAPPTGDARTWSDTVTNSPSAEGAPLDPPSPETPGGPPPTREHAPGRPDAVDDSARSGDLAPRWGGAAAADGLPSGPDPTVSENAPPPDGATRRWLVRDELGGPGSDDDDRAPAGPGDELTRSWAAPEIGGGSDHPTGSQAASSGWRRSEDDWSGSAADQPSAGGARAAGPPYPAPPVDEPDPQSPWPPSAYGQQAASDDRPADTGSWSTGAQLAVGDHPPDAGLWSGDAEPGSPAEDQPTGFEESDDRATRAHSTGEPGPGQFSPLLPSAPPVPDDAGRYGTPTGVLPIPADPSHLGSGARVPPGRLGQFSGGSSTEPGQFQPGPPAGPGAHGHSGPSGHPAPAAHPGAPGQPAPFGPYGAGPAGQFGGPGQAGQFSGPDERGQFGGPGQPGGSGWPGRPNGPATGPGPYAQGQPGHPGPYGGPGDPARAGYPGGQHPQPGSRGLPGPAAQSAAPGQPTYPPGPGLPSGPGLPPGVPPTVDQLTAQSLLRQRRPSPQTGWRRAVYNISAHALNPGQSNEDRRRQELVARASVPVRGCYRIAVISLKGGVGKTTTTVTLGATLASLRGDRVIAVDANPDRGTLSGKIPLETVATVRNLLNDVDDIQHYFDVRRYTSQSADRLEVLASESDPAVSIAFSESDYRTVASVLERFYNIVLTDCGTGLLHSAMTGVLDLADQIVLVSSGSVDGARSASATLDWLEAHGRGELVRNSVAVINSVRPKSGGVDLDRLEAHFAARCRAVTRMPYDPHLEEGAEVDLGELSAGSRSALLELAAAVADAFPRDPRASYTPPPPPES